MTALILDANILLRATLGLRVLGLLRKYSWRVEFSAPDTAFREARENLPGILERRKASLAPVMLVLDSLIELVQTVEPETYRQFESLARERIKVRDEEDWPILASALALNCPIWTEDADFFGCGVATWTSDRVEPYLAASGAQ